MENKEYNVTKLKDDDVLLRYMCFSKFIDLVHNQHLFFPRADTFNDKHEGYYTKLVYEISKSNTVDVDGKSSNKGLYENTKKIRASAYINCWTISQYESVAHWQIYGGNNSVAIVTTVGELRKQLVTSTTHEIAKFMKRVIEPIEYIDHHSIDQALAKELLNDLLNPLKKKNMAFEHEKEVRMIYHHLQHNSSDFEQKLGKGFIVGINRNKLINEIIISPKAEDWFFSLVKLLMVNYELSEKVKWSKLRFTPFEEVFGESNS